jgi:hypothetical protein
MRRAVDAGGGCVAQSRLAQGRSFPSLQSEYRLTRREGRFAVLPYAVYHTIHRINALVHYEASIA